MDELEGIAKVAIAVIIVVIQAVAALRKHRAQREQLEPTPRPASPRPARPVPPPAPPQQARKPAARPSAARPPGLDPALARALDKLARNAQALSLALEQQRSARRFQPVVDTWFPAQLAAVRAQLSASGGDKRGRSAVAMLSLVLAEVERMAADRRDPQLTGALGDADALASACYAPIIAHARAEGLPLTVSEPATRWGNFQMAVWTGFGPTGCAPIFLPEDFFRRAAWWPAVAHEIGHSFLASVRGLDAGLRQELGLGEEWLGLKPLDLSGEGLSRAELVRVMGGWFEELFCDVFGTLMCGPAYVRSMITLFSAKDDPREVLAVASDGNFYDMHPPRHLRVIAGCRVLERAGLDDDAEALRAEWDARHTLGGRAPDRILFPVDEGFVAVPLEPLEALVGQLAERLYDGPLRALGGVGLEDISGLDYGPHEHREALRARDALLGGRVPVVRDPRAVIAGAVLAAHAKPADEARILTRARAAIPGRDTGEVRPDAYQQAGVQTSPAGLAAPAGRRAAARRRARPGPGISAAEVRDAIVLGAVLNRPRFPSRSRFARRP